MEISKLVECVYSLKTRLVCETWRVLLNMRSWSTSFSIGPWSSLLKCFIRNHGSLRYTIWLKKLLFLGHFFLFFLPFIILFFLILVVIEIYRILNWKKLFFCYWWCYLNKVLVGGWLWSFNFSHHYWLKWIHCQQFDKVVWTAGIDFLVPLITFWPQHLVWTLAIVFLSMVLIVHF